ncbi:phage tail fiber protein [Spirillospora sp. CA-294931]|uniref:phage tail fiber protein n=1 Tax=Spirillospora sp. CA-294931 TaxID=3240042 RepID=UPI003D8DFA5B
MLTNGGRDHALACVYGTAAQPAAANYLALSANSAAPNAANTTLPGEITTSGGGLVRAQATYAHTNGQATATLTKTFTANGSDALPVTIAKIGIFNAPSSGTLTNETLLSATATLSAAGDALTITDTITVS